MKKKISKPDGSGGITLPSSFSRRLMHFNPTHKTISNQNFHFFFSKGFSNLKKISSVSILYCLDPFGNPSARAGNFVSQDLEFFRDDSLELKGNRIPFLTTLFNGNKFKEQDFVHW